LQTYLTNGERELAKRGKKHTATVVRELCLRMHEKGRTGCIRRINNCRSEEGEEGGRGVVESVFSQWRLVTHTVREKEET